MISVDIKNEIRQGRDVTHILNIKINSNEGDDIRQLIFNIIGGKPISIRVLNQDVTIIWKTSSKTSSIYYCDSPFTNKFVIAHTKKLFNYVLNKIEKQFNNTSLDFIVTNPILERIPNINQFDN